MPGSQRDAVISPSETTEVRNESQRKRQPYFNVVLLDDNQHTYEYVIEMLGRLFRYSRQKALLIAHEVDTKGRAVVLTTTKEHGELKQEQIHGFGADERLPKSLGSMRARLEPVE